MQKWHFPSTDGGEDDGLNDPLRETFEGDHDRYVAREAIQNSIDARDDYTKPVQVVFSVHSVPKSSIPGVNEFHKVLELAHDYAKGQEKAERFFNGTFEILEEEQISVLKVSDFNTTGLRGSDTNKDGEWYRLIRSTGSSSMSGPGGGSFGIGKGAPFAASALRLVFYSTMSCDGVAFQGKARLSSFKYEDDVKRGVGFFGKESGRRTNAIRNSEEIPEFFRRQSIGTDIFMVAYDPSSINWIDSMIKSVLSNFWAAIFVGDLVVDFRDADGTVVSCNTDTLEDLLNEHFHKTWAADSPRNFFNAMKRGVRITQELPRLGECSLYVLVEDELPKAVQAMRASHMVIETYDRFRVLPKPYSAVFVCANETGNRLLRQLEPPSHDKWDPAREKKHGPKIVKELQKFIKDTLKTFAPESNSNPEEIPDLGDFLPDDEVINAGMGAGVLDESASTQPKSADGIEKAKRFDAFPKVSPPSIEFSRLTGSRGPGAEKRKLTEESKGTKKKNKGTGDDSGNIKKIDADFVRMRCKERVDEFGREIVMQIESSKDQSGELKIVAKGDEGGEGVTLMSARLADGTELPFADSVISGLSLYAGSPVQVSIRIAGNRRYVLGVA